LGYLKGYHINRLEARIALYDRSRAIVTALLERHAILAAKGFYALHSFEITVAAKALTVQTRPSSYVCKNLHPGIGLFQKVNRFWKGKIISAVRPCRQ
jgi:hypothetical protein